MSLCLVLGCNEYISSASKRGEEFKKKEMEKRVISAISYQQVKPCAKWKSLGWMDGSVMWFVPEYLDMQIWEGWSGPRWWAWWSLVAAWQTPQSLWYTWWTARWTYPTGPSPAALCGLSLSSRRGRQRVCLCGCKNELTPCGVELPANWSLPWCIFPVGTEREMSLGELCWLY